MGTCRFVYNRALHAVKHNYETDCSFFALRDKYVTKKDNLIINDWELETPKDVRAGALQDLSFRYFSLIQMIKDGLITRFDMKFRSKKKDTSIVIPKSTINIEYGNLSIYKKKFGFGLLRLTSRQDKFLKKNPIEKDCRLQVKRGKYFLCVPMTIKKETIGTRSDCCSLDPGVRKFQTIYSKKEVVHVGVKRELLKRYFDKLDKLQSLRMKGVVRKNKKKHENKIRDKIENVIDDLHYQTINYITKKYNNIILPTFESQKLLKKMDARISRRMMLAYKQYQFKTRLQQKCEQRRNRLILCTEEYTSKTCGRCGVIKTNLRREETYECKECGLKIDRDINGARNIMIKVLMEKSQ
jgi:putative transposase